MCKLFPESNVSQVACLNKMTPKRLWVYISVRSVVPPSQGPLFSLNTWPVDVCARWASLRQSSNDSSNRGGYVCGCFWQNTRFDFDFAGERKLQGCRRGEEESFDASCCELQLIFIVIIFFEVHPCCGSKEGADCGGHPSCFWRDRLVGLFSSWMIVHMLENWFIDELDISKFWQLFSQVWSTVSMFGLSWSVLSAPC